MVYNQLIKSTLLKLNRVSKSNYNKFFNDFIDND